MKIGTAAGVGHPGHKGGGMLSGIASTGLVGMLLVGCWLQSARADPSQDRPNIVVFLVDDLGWRDVGCYGSSFYETPNIDRLAGESVRFTDAYAACHVCSPTRAAILTGKYPARLKLTDWLPGRRDFPFQRLKNAACIQQLPLDEVTLAEALKEHGYRTGHFGKWHLGEEPYGPMAQGFDVQVPRWNKGWPRQGYHAPFGLDGLEDQPGDYLTDRLTDEAVKFIEAHADQPFFLYLSHFAVHDPLQGRADLVGKYERRRAELPPPAGPEFLLEGNPDSPSPADSASWQRLLGHPDYQGHRVFRGRLVKVKQRQDNPQFAAMVESMDQSLGRVRQTLQRLGLNDRTIILFCSDNGGMAAANFGRPSRVIPDDKLDAAYSTANVPLRGAKGWLYEGGIRVPMIVHWPGRGRPGAESQVPVISTDIYPTVLEMAGLPPRPQQHVDGVSLAALIAGEAESVDRDAIFWHFPHYSNHGMQSPGSAIRMGNYKLLHYFERDTVQLFDLSRDVGEQHDLAKEKPELAARLLRRLDAWRSSVGASMMDLNPDFDPAATPASVSQ